MLFAAINYVLVTGLWGRLHAAVLYRLDGADPIDVTHGGSPNQTRPPLRLVLRAVMPACGQSSRPGWPAQVASRRIGVRIVRKDIESSEGLRAPPTGHRAHHVVAVPLPSAQPSLRARPTHNYLAFLGLAAALCRCALTSSVSAVRGPPVVAGSTSTVMLVNAASSSSFVHTCS